MTNLAKQVFWCIVFLAAVLLLETYTDMDLWLQNLLYDPARGSWLIDRAAHEKWGIVFYKGIKNAIIVLGVVSLIVFALSFKKPQLLPLRRPALLLFLSIVLVPVIVAGSKQITNVYCPDQLSMYGGRFPWVRVLESYPDGFEQIKRGKCFPAGHATTGFALMMLYFCFNDRRKKLLGLALGISLGWLTGVYQMLRGEHFISHTLFTFAASWLVIILINALVSKRLPASH